MKLSASIIENELSKNYNIVKSYCPDTCLILKPPLYYSPSMMTFDDYRVYICEHEAPQSIAGLDHCLFIFFSSLWDHDSLSNYIILDSQTTPSEIMNHLLITFEQFDEWDRKLGTIQSEDQIQEILDFSVPFFTNMLVLTDAAFRVIAYSVYQPETGRSGQFGSIPTTTNDRYVKLKDYYLEHSSDTDCFIVPEMILGFRKLACNLFLAGNNIGAITVHPTLQPFSKQDAELLLFMCRRIEQSMGFLLGDIRLEGQLDRILRKMLANEHVTEEELELANYCSGIEAREQYRAIVIPIPTLKENEFVLYLRRRLSSIIALSAFFEYDQHIYALIHAREGSSRSELIEEFKQMLDILAMRGGVSDEFTKLELFPCYCREAHYAVHHGADRADSHLLYFQNWKLDYIIEHAVGELKKEMLIPQSFFQLIELDQQKKTNYLQTLEVFLKENMNGYKAAQELYIHRNTLMARMSHIEQILGVDLNDYDTRFLVELYIKLYRAE